MGAKTKRDRKSVVVRVLVTREEADRIAARAASENRSVSSWGRLALVAELGRGAR